MKLSDSNIGVRRGENIKNHQKCQLPRWPGSAASRLANYTKEILNNTKENQETGYFSFCP